MNTGNGCEGHTSWWWAVSLGSGWVVTLSGFILDVWSVDIFIEPMMPIWFWGHGDLSSHLLWCKGAPQFLLMQRPWTYNAISLQLWKPAICWTPQIGNLQTISRRNQQKVQFFYLLAALTNVSTHLKWLSHQDIQVYWTPKEMLPLYIWHNYL